MVKRVPVRPDLIVDHTDLRREPVSRNYVAFVVGRGLSIGSIKPDDLYADLHESIIGIIAKRAMSFSCSLRREDVNDLISECSVKFFRSLSKYNPEDGAITTWTWRVSNNFLTTKYRSRSKMDVVPIEECAGVGVPHFYSSDVTDDIRRFIRALIERHPERESLIKALFFDPDSPSVVVPRRLSPKEASAATGIEPSVIGSFVARSVRQLWKEWFGEPSVVKKKRRSSRNNILDMTRSICSKYDRPLSTEEIVNHAVSSGVYSPRARDPVKSVRQSLSRAARSGASDLIREGDSWSFR